MIRVITASNEKGDREVVVFTEDFETPAKYFFFMGTGGYDTTIRIDEILDVDMPGRFPIDYILLRE